MSAVIVKKASVKDVVFPDFTVCRMAPNPYVKGAEKDRVVAQLCLQWATTPTGNELDLKKDRVTVVMVVEVATVPIDCRRALRAKRRSCGEDVEPELEDEGLGDQFELLSEKAFNDQMRAAKKKLVDQLRDYMKRLGEDGDRWNGDVMGLAIIGDEVAFMIHDESDFSGDTWVLVDKEVPPHLENVEWFSLYGEEFRTYMERVRNA